MKILAIIAGIAIVIIIILLLQNPGPDQAGDFLPEDQGAFSSSGNTDQDGTSGPADIPTGPGFSGYTSITDYQTGPGSSGSPANFRVDRTSGSAPLTISFTDSSAGSPDAWFWNFDDGSTSREENPVHTFFSPGTYRVSLTVTDDGRSYEKALSVTVTASELEASFTAYPSSGTAPLDVDFTDESSGSPTSWSWTFGDGGTSSTRHPSNKFINPGSYRVTLVVERDGSTDARSTTITVYEQAAQSASSFTIPATPPPTAQATVKATAVPTTEGKPVPTTKTACSYYYYTINGRTVSGTCCGSLSSSMQCSGGVCQQVYTCNGVRIG